MNFDMKSVLLALLALSTFVVAEPVAFCWKASSSEVSGYRIYKCDVNNRMFVKTSTDTKAIIDVAGGESVFITAFRGVLESDPSEALVFTLQESHGLAAWKNVAKASPTESRYFTRIKTLIATQPLPLVPGNSMSIPEPPSAPVIDSNPLEDPTNDPKS